MEKQRQISVKQAAEILGKSPAWVRRMLSRRLISGYQYTNKGHWVISQIELEQFKERHKRA
jgi:predicted transcriptional regulator of viral defense system